MIAAFDAAGEEGRDFGNGWSGCVAGIVFQQAAEEALALSSSDRAVVGIVEHLRSCIGGCRDGAVPQPLVWPDSVVEASVFLSDVIEVAGQAGLAGKTVYVRTSGSDANSGLSWAFAKKTVAAGLGAAASGDEVWVARCDRSGRASRVQPVPFCDRFGF